MATRGRHGGPHRGEEDDREHRHHEREHEPYDNPREHLEIERSRFAGGLSPTPELYALAREQWYRLPGVFARPSMDPVVSDPASAKAQLTDRSHPDEKEPER